VILIQFLPSSTIREIFTEISVHKTTSKYSTSPPTYIVNPSTSSYPPKNLLGYVRITQVARGIPGVWGNYSICATPLAMLRPNMTEQPICL